MARVDRPELLRNIVRLGREFRRVGLNDHLKKLRTYYRLVRSDLTTPPKHRVEISWNAEFVEEWLGLLRVPPFENKFDVRPHDAKCRKCKLEQTGGLFTAAAFPGGFKSKCRHCGDEWLTLD